METVIGIDIDSIELKNAKVYLKQTANVSLSQQSAKQTAFPNKTFDAVITVGNTFGNLGDEKENILREMIRLLKNDGWLFISVFAKDATSERIAAYRKIGLDINRVVDGRILFSDGYVSEGFEENQLKKLFRQYDLESKIVRVGSIGLCATLRRK